MKYMPNYRPINSCKNCRWSGLMGCCRHPNVVDKQPKWDGYKHEMSWMSEPRWNDFIEYAPNDIRAYHEALREWKSRAAVGAQFICDNWEAMPGPQPVERDPI